MWLMKKGGAGNVKGMEQHGTHQHDGTDKTHTLKQKGVRMLKEVTKGSELQSENVRINNISQNKEGGNGTIVDMSDGTTATDKYRPSGG